MLRNMICIYALTYLLGAFYYIEYDILRTQYYIQFQNFKEKKLRGLHEEVIPARTNIRPKHSIYIRTDIACPSAFYVFRKFRTIRFYLDTLGTQPNFLRYFMNIKFYLNIVILFYIWQWLAYCFDQSTELNVAKFLQKSHM